MQIDIAHIRAVRNNNPGNLRIGARWIGLMAPGDMTQAQASEHAFCVFQSAPYGFRAMAEVLKNYPADLVKQGKYFCVEHIIGRWAPPDENNTQAYIAAVCERTGYGATDPLPVDFIHVGALCKAISTQEVGVWAFNDADLSAGLRLAGF